ncbi:MAG: Ig-like domain-containing protein, partial [Candidatus Woesearchaeota archaeon]
TDGVCDATDLMTQTRTRTSTDACGELAPVTETDTQEVVCVFNLPPIINSYTGSTTTPEETSLTFTLDDFEVSDPNDDPLTVTVQDGDNYVVDSTTITPVADFNGDLTVVVEISDGELSDSITLTITVTPVNDAPRITGQVPLTTAEDTPLTISIDDLVIEDADSTVFTLTVLSGSNYVVSGTTITPAHNFNGLLTVNVRVNDGTTNSNTFPLRVTVTAVNDAPVITSTPITTAVVDQPYNYQVTVSDDSLVTYHLNNGPSGMTISSNGLVTWTATEPGSYSVFITVSDGEYDVTQKYTISVASSKTSVQLMTVHVGPEEATGGDVLSVNVALDNKGNTDLENAKVTVLLPELGIKRSSKTFDINAGETKRGAVKVQLPAYLDEGEYLVKVTVNNDQYHETSYRYVYVVNK